MKSSSVTIQMKATEQYFPVVLFIMLYKVVLTFESVDEILLCDHSNGNSLPVFSRGIFFFLTIKILLLCSLLGVKGEMATIGKWYQLSFLERYLPDR